MTDLAVRYIVKPIPEVDYYACFCTNVGDFLYGGPRTWWEDQYEEYPGEHAADRFERADANGTSAIPEWGELPSRGWDETGIFLNRGTSNGWVLQRTDIQEYLRRKQLGESVDDLLTMDQELETE